MTNPLEQIREELRDKIAKAIADVIGHGMREKRKLHADAVMKILNAGQGYVCVPVEPTRKMILAGKHTIKGCDNGEFESRIAEMIFASMLAASKETNRD